MMTIYAMVDIIAMIMMTNRNAVASRKLRLLKILRRHFFGVNASRAITRIVGKFGGKYATKRSQYYEAALTFLGKARAFLML